MNSRISMFLSLTVSLVLSLATTQVVAYPDYADGDLAPLGAPDGLLNAADYQIASRIAVGELVATELELSHGDVFPAAAPDGVINVQDLLQLRNLALGGAGSNTYVEILDLYLDGPATESASVGGSTGVTTLQIGSWTGSGASVTNNAGLIDPQDASNTIWHFAVSGGTANTFIGTDDLTSDPVLDSGFDLSGAADGQLVFDIKVNSITPGTTITFKIDSGWPQLGQVVMQSNEFTVGSWQRISLDMADILSDTGPGSGLDVYNVVNAFVIEIAGGAADVYLDNIFFSHACTEAGACHATVNTKPDYQLIWSDEFDGTSLNTDNWVHETGYGGSFGWGNDEWQLYTTSTNNVAVTGGNLEIKAQCSNPPNNCGKRDGTITSGRIKTLNKFHFKYGKIEARMKLPVGTGAWPAFWMLGANFPTVGWPNSGEIDIMEVNNLYSNEFTTHSTVHYCDDYVSNPCVYDPGWEFTGSNLSIGTSLGDDFHVYSLEWDEDTITSKLDGVTFFTHVIDPGNMAEFREEFFTILNVAIGGTLGGAPDASTPWPQVMQVDYVRVYQDPEGNGTFTIPGVIPPATDAGIYSETHTDPTVHYSEIINSIDWGGNWTAVDLYSTAVTPLDGSNVLEATFAYSGKTYGGFIYNLGATTDISNFQTIKFAVDTSAMSSLANMRIQIENPGGAQPAPRVDLASYTPTMNANWAQYEIPLADFTGQAVSLDLTSVIYIGFWNPVNSSNALIFGDLYFDDIHLSGGTP